MGSEFFFKIQQLDCQTKKVQIYMNDKKSLLLTNFWVSEPKLIFRFVVKRISKIIFNLKINFDSVVTINIIKN